METGGVKFLHCKPLSAELRFNYIHGQMHNAVVKATKMGYHMVAEANLFPHIRRRYSTIQAGRILLKEKRSLQNKVKVG